MTKAENILLCGCGWLGEQLIPALKEAQYTISATSRNKEKIATLIALNVCGAPFSLGTPFPDYLLFDKLSTTAIIMLPPGRKSTSNGKAESKKQWEANLHVLFEQLFKGKLEHLIFISTTSVYGDDHAKDTLCEVIEGSELRPETESAKAHVRIERHLQQQWPDKTTIVRLAGLVGPNRHPINTLTGRALTAPNKIANLVHSHDIVNALLRLIELGPQAQPLHLCSMDHPQRKTYYDASAKAFKLAPALFTPDADLLESTGKKVNAKASWERLSVTLKYPTPFDMLPP